MRQALDYRPQARRTVGLWTKALRCVSAAGVVLVLAGCSSTKRLGRLDRRTLEFLDAVQLREFKDETPESLELDAYTAYAKPGGDGSVRLDLRQALAVGARHSRQYQTAREDLYQSAMALVSAAHTWDWLPTQSLQAMLGRNLAGPDTALNVDGSAGFSKRFVSGARLTGSLAFYSLRYLSGSREVTLNTMANLTLTVPLLGGSSRLVTREPLTQAERDLVYALRAYVRQRKSLLIDIADRYYAVLSALDGLEIARRNLANLKESRERSEAMAESGRVPLFQVDQGRQRELDAQSSLVQREEAYQSRQDDLKEILGLPRDVPIELERADLDRLAAASLPQPAMDFDTAVALALERRLDWATVKDRLDDASRHTQVAKDALRAHLDLKLAGQASSPTDSRLRSPDLDKGNYTAQLDADLPFDRTAETIAYRRALIAEQRQTRTVTQEHDRIIAELRSVWRRLRSSEQNYQIQRLSVDLAGKRVESTELLFQAGRVNIREVLDARDSLIVAENAVTVALVEHRMNWLRLMYQLEQMPTEPDTLWSPALALQPMPDGVTP